MDKISNKKLLIIAYLLIIFQFASYSLAPNIGIKIFATLCTKHIAGMLFIMINLKVVSTIVNPLYQISALALVSTISRNLATIGLQNVAGQILDKYSYDTLFLVMMILAIIGLIIVLFYKIPKGDLKKLFS